MLSVVGIDPGQNGGIACRHGDQWIVHPMPVMESGVSGRVQLDMKEFKKLIQGLEFHRRVQLVVVEVVTVIPINGSLTIAAMHRMYGEIRGILEGLGCRTEYVPTTVWQKVLFPGKKKDKKDKPSIPYVRDRFPDIDISLPAKRSGKNKGKVEYHDGLADAICICEYGCLRVPTLGPEHDLVPIISDLPASPPHQEPGQIGTHQRQHRAVSRRRKVI